MLKDFNTYLESIDSEFWSLLCREQGVLRKYKKGEEFITIGKVARYIGLIKEGSVKYVAYTANYDEKIVGLETVDGFAASWPFCLQGLPSIVSIIANSDLEMYCLSVSKINELAKNDLCVERQIAQANEQLFYTAYERLISLYIQSPKERYNTLIEKSPRVFEIFDLKDIASFLNITPQHLSRLRKANVKQS
ncbi:MAG: Crp/Fnr family transcriptional regulator [Muribaculaceae bacterium]|nr:Crp/Fnr family transcriptional regulator [Muribaculaceae bacterium]